MLYGYIRVSTGTQAIHGYSLDEQKQALMNAGVEEKRIFMDAAKPEPISIVMVGLI